MSSHQHPQHRTRALIADKQCLTECFNRALQLAKVQSLDYAHEMFANCVIFAPENVEYAEAMVRNLRALRPVRRKSPLLFVGSNHRNLKKAVRSCDCPTAFRLAIGLLSRNPWDVGTLRALATVCESLRHNEVELVYLKLALDAQPKNVEVNRHCAKSLARMGQFDQAITCWHRVEKLGGRREEAVKQIIDLMQEKLRYSQLKSQPAVAVKADVPKQATTKKPSEQKSDVAACQVAVRPGSLRTAELERLLETSGSLVRNKRFDAAERIVLQGIRDGSDQHCLRVELDRIRRLRSARVPRASESTIVKETSPESGSWTPLETVTIALVGVLFAQLVPGFTTALTHAGNVSRWHGSDWLLFNAAIMGGLVVLRFRPSIGRVLAQIKRLRKSKYSKAIL